MADCSKCKRIDIKCCTTCKKDADKCGVLHHCGSDCPKHESRIITNADRIRSMTDAELAEFINTVSNDSIDTITAYGTKSHTEVWENKESTMQWLQAEAE